MKRLFVGIDDGAARTSEISEVTLVADDVKYRATHEGWEVALRNSIVIPMSWSRRAERWPDTDMDEGRY